MIDLNSTSDEELRAGARGAELVKAEPDVLRRALLAFLKSTKMGTAPDTIAIAHLGKVYIALSVSSGIAGIYRVRNDLQLKRMRRTPQAVAYTAELERRAAQGRSLKYA